jgi:hypothetical protein
MNFRISRKTKPTLISSLDRPPLIIDARSRATAVQHPAIPYDISNVTFSYRGALCGSIAFTYKFGLTDPALLDVAMPAQGLVLNDALYACCRDGRGERLDWNPGFPP